MSLLSKIRGAGPSGFGYGSTAEEVVQDLDLSGKTILITGVNSGIGLASASALAGRGARIIGLARTEEKAARALKDLPGEHVPVACELSEPSSIKKAASILPECDTFLFNAGIMALPERQESCGIELQFFTNHIGHFLLFKEGEGRLKRGGRLVVVASEAHRGAPREGIAFGDLSAEKSYVPWQAYGQSKLANILFAKEAAKRLKGRALAFSLHPGVIATNLARSMSFVTRVALSVAEPLVLKTISEGASTQCFAAVHPKAEAMNGAYLSHCNLATPTRHGQDADMAAKLWDESEKIVAAL